MRAGDRVFSSAFSEQASRGVGPIRGPHGLAALVRFLQTLEPTGSSNLTNALHHARAARQDRGLVIVLSDFLNVPSREQAIAAVGSHGGTVLAIQILDPIDRGEGLRGKLRLRDSETGRLVDVDLDRAGLADFQAIFEAERARFESFCTAGKRYYVSASTSDNYLGIVCDALRAKGVLQ